ERRCQSCDAVVEWLRAAGLVVRKRASCRKAMLQRYRRTGGESLCDQYTCRASFSSASVLDLSKLRRRRSLISAQGSRNENPGYANKKCIQRFNVLVPRGLASSHPGLKLANAFGVICSNSN